jgi:hypothetical protein
MSQEPVLVPLIRLHATSVDAKNAVYWDVMQRGSCKNRRFGGT